jgi:restriction system protein
VKRHKNFIGAEWRYLVRAFFITTPTFDDSVHKKAKEAHHRTIILIDGLKLVDLMHQYNVVQVKLMKSKNLTMIFFEED